MKDKDFVAKQANPFGQGYQPIDDDSKPVPPEGGTGAIKPMDYKKMWVTLKDESGYRWCQPHPTSRELITIRELMSDMEKRAKEDITNTRLLEYESETILPDEINREIDIIRDRVLDTLNEQDKVFLNIENLKTYLISWFAEHNLMRD